jgi:peptidyl-prolyl cis-trans isomerase C
MFQTEISAYVRRAAGAAFLPAGLPLAPAYADEPTDVMARVGTYEINRAELDLAIELFGEQLAQVPEDQRPAVVLGALIDMHLVADAARKDGLDQGELYQKRVEFLQNQALRTTFIEEKVQKAVTEEELKARYEKDIASYTPPEEVKAAHILVETEDEAKAIIADIEKGADFAVLAKEKSKDPGSKDNGGDLGYFSKGQMVPEFETAAFEMNVGDVSKTPVKSQFGFHVIKVEDKRKQPVPTFESVKAQIQPAVEREKFEKLMADLKAATKVERFDAPPQADPAEDPGDQTPPDEDADEDGDEAADPAPAQ